LINFTVSDLETDFAILLPLVITQMFLELLMRLAMKVIFSEVLR
jgi:hypothetical protein